MLLASLGMRPLRSPRLASPRPLEAGRDAKVRWWGREGPQFPGRGLCALSRRRAGSGGGQTASLPAQLRDPTCAPGPPGRRDSGRLRTWGASPRRRGRTAEPERAGGPAGCISRSAAGSKKQNSELDSHAPPRPLTRPGQARGAQRAPSGAVPSPPSNTTSRNTCPSYPVWLGPRPRAAPCAAQNARGRFGAKGGAQSPAFLRPHSMGSGGQWPAARQRNHRLRSAPPQARWRPQTAQPRSPAPDATRGRRRFSPSHIWPLSPPRHFSSLAGFPPSCSSPFLSSPSLTPFLPSSSPAPYSSAAYLRESPKQPS